VSSEAANAQPLERNGLAERQMGQILKFTIPEAAFDPDTVDALAVAYEKATSQLRGQAYTDTVRELIAKRIIARAIKGERDPDRLCTSVLNSLGFPD
jgi:hypothetical protein